MLRSRSDNQIRTRPRLCAHTLRRPPLRGLLPVSLANAHIAFYPKARNAIWYAVKALHLSPGQNILVPAYHCGSELDAILKAGVEVKFYRVDHAARIDLDHLRRTLDTQTGAVLMIHYFGFPQEDMPTLMTLCRERGLYLLEDCAHALYSRTAAGCCLGTSGDLGIFSLWKGLPLQDGGATRINNPTLKVEAGTVSRPLYARLRDARYRLENRMVKRYGPLGRGIKRLGIEPVAAVVKRVMRRQHSALAQAEAAKDSEPPNPHVTFDLRTAELRMSPWSGYLLRRIDHRQVVETRRRNFQFLTEALRDLSSVRLLYPVLPEGVCPLCLPILVDDAPSLHAHLLCRRIAVDLFWNEFHPLSPREEFPESMALKTHMVGLPIHQDIDLPALQRIVEAVFQWSRSC